MRSHAISHAIDMVSAVVFCKYFALVNGYTCCLFACCHGYVLDVDGHTFSYCLKLVCFSTMNHPLNLHNLGGELHKSTRPCGKAGTMYNIH